MTDELKKYRDKIDAIDSQILALVNKRASLAREIGHIKQASTEQLTVIYRPEREAQVLRRLQEENVGPLSDEAVSDIFRGVVANCRALEKKLSVAFLGPLGTYSEEAALKQFGQSQQAIVCSSIDEVFRSVAANQADYGVIPVENSTEGAVGLTLDLLSSSALKICGEVTLPIRHCLLSKQTDINQISRVFSHSQSLSQCHEWLNKHLPNVEREAVSSNARAAEMAHQRVASEDTFVAAIASKRAAALFALNILAENIEDDYQNTTRFLVLGKQDVARSGHDKTSIIVNTHNKPGAMLEVLQPLAEHHVSMTKFESRPAKTGLWEYVFFIDIQGHLEDNHIKLALAAINDKAPVVKVMGSYPVAVV